MSIEPTIFADTESGPCVWVRVVGKGTFQNSHGLKEFTRAMIDAGRREFAVDLKDCPSMDSTFMGTLAGIVLRMRDKGGGKLWILNRNDRNADLLEGLGLSALFCQEPPPERYGTDYTEVLNHQGDRVATRETMREAHEHCIEVNPANAEEFHGVIENLKASAARDAGSNGRQP